MSKAYSYAPEAANHIKPAKAENAFIRACFKGQKPTGLYETEDSIYVKRSLERSRKFEKLKAKSLAKKESKADKTKRSEKVDSPEEISSSLEKMKIEDAPDVTSWEDLVGNDPADEDEDEDDEPEIIVGPILSREEYLEKKSSSPKSFGSTESMKIDTHSKGIDVLKDSKKLENKLYRTKLCDSIKNGVKCRHGINCRFAHTQDELEIPICCIGEKCRYVRFMQTCWVNIGEKVCKFRHPNETKANFNVRTGIIPPPVLTPPSSQPIVMRVPFHMIQSAMEMVLRNGSMNVVIEPY